MSSTHVVYKAIREAELDMMLLLLLSLTSFVFPFPRVATFTVPRFMDRSPLLADIAAAEDRYRGVSTR